MPASLFSFHFVPRFSRFVWFVCLTLGAVVFSGCEQKAGKAVTETQVVEMPRVEPSPEPEIEVRGPVAEVEPVEKKRSKHLAPEGTYFLVVDHSIEENDALLGFRAGTQVIRQGDSNEYLANGKKITLTADQVTNDFRVLKRLMKASKKQIVYQQVSAATPR